MKYTYVPNFVAFATSIISHQLPMAIPLRRAKLRDLGTSLKKILVKGFDTLVFVPYSYENFICKNNYERCTKSGFRAKIQYF